MDKKTAENSQIKNYDSSLLEGSDFIGYENAIENMAIQHIDTIKNPLYRKQSY